MSFDTDVLIVGAGPAGLAQALALAQAGLKVRLFERQTRAALAEPAPDGRDIALTHRGRQILESLGVWTHFPPEHVFSLKQAWVLDGTSTRALRFDGQAKGVPELGWLVPNYVIRRGVFEKAMQYPDQIQLEADVAVRSVSTDETCAKVVLNDGQVFTAPLLLAADSRLSTTRRQLGIGADMLDFGRSVIVCRMTHEGLEDGTAYECFLYGSTLAILPLGGGQVSAVVTVPSRDAPALMDASPEVFGRIVTERFKLQDKPMKLLGERHIYPLVAVWAHRFAGQRCAMIGDAAVGMHPVTAHGYNFGLYGVEALTREIVKARKTDQDIGSGKVLNAFQAEHRRVTWPIYTGTNFVVKLFTDDRPMARMARKAVLHAAEMLSPVRSLVTQQLISSAKPS